VDKPKAKREQKENTKNATYDDIIIQIDDFGNELVRFGLRITNRNVGQGRVVCVERG
jgi:hypothetical protein